MTHELSGLNKRDFVCGAMSLYANSSLHWSVIHYQEPLSDILGVVRKCLLFIYMGGHVIYCRNVAFHTNIPSPC